MKSVFRIIRTFIHASLIFAVSACGETETPISSLVVEGYISDGDYAKICLTQTISPDVAGTTLTDMIVRWGKVTLSDGEDSVILTGGPDHDFFPPYTYTTYDLNGQTGKSYTLTAEYGEMSVSARTTIPPAADIDSITVRHAGSDGSQRQLLLYPRVAPGTKEYYRILVRVKDSHDRLLPGFMGLAESSGTDTPVAIAVNRPKTSRDSCDYIPAFLPGEIVEVALCTMEKEAYDFWLDYENTVAFSGSQFLTPATPIRSNIAGGYGYFFGYGMTRRIIEID